MKFLKQFGIILTITFAGELLRAILPLPIPVSIYGLLLLLFLLSTHILPLSAVQDAGKFLIEIMPVMFIPAGVGLLTSWDALRSVLLPIVVIILVTTVFVMAVTGRVTQKMIRSRQHRESERNTESGLEKREKTAGGRK